MIKIKTVRAEFDAARSNGYVYGKIIRQEVFSAYVELGIEREYIPAKGDDPKTEYRFFTNCFVSVAETDDALDQEDYISSEGGASVLIYC